MKIEIAVESAISQVSATSHNIDIYFIRNSEQLRIKVKRKQHA